MIIKNGIIAERLEDPNCIFEFELGDNPELIALLKDNSNEAWNKLWDIVSEVNPDADPRGRMNVQYIVIDGVKAVFH